MKIIEVYIFIYNSMGGKIYRTDTGLWFVEHPIFGDLTQIELEKVRELTGNNSIS